MKNTILIKKNGVINTIDRTEAKEKEINNCELCHLCWEGECANAYPGKCMKVANHNKNIEKYDFIEEGIAFKDENDTTDKLIVTKCKNYVPYELEEKTVTNRVNKSAELRKLRNKLIMTYYGVNSIEEAENIIIERINNNRIDFPKGYVSKKVLEKTLLNKKNH